MVLNVKKSKEEGVGSASPEDQILNIPRRIKSSLWRSGGQAPTNGKYFFSYNFVPPGKSKVWSVRGKNLKRWRKRAAYFLFLSYIDVITSVSGSYKFVLPEQTESIKL